MTDDKQKLLKEYLLNKYSDEARQNLVEKAKDESSGPNWAAGLAGLGAAISGQGAVGAVNAGQKIASVKDARRQEELKQFDKGREQVLKDYLMAKNDSRYMEEREFDKQKHEEDKIFRQQQLEQRAADRAEAREARKAQREESREWRQQDKQDARDFKVEQTKAKQNEKNKESVKEIEIRRQNIMENIALLKKMIDEDGTYEIFGPHNANLSRKVDNIAVDMAKLTDPNSVARPSEVEMFKKGLIEPGLGMRNSTALKILDEFEKEVDTRMEKAYSIRGLDNPANKTKQAPQMVALQAPNGKIIRVPEDKVEEAISKGAKALGTQGIAGRTPQSQGNM